MKFQSIVYALAGAVLITGSFNAAAAGFGGQWGQSGGTLSNSSMERVTPSGTSGSGKGTVFGAEWAFDRSGTIYNAGSRDVRPQQIQASARMEKKSRKGGFGDRWAHDRYGTLSTR